MANEQTADRERRFRAVDVLTGTIDRTEAPRRARKQISAYLYPEQVRALGELHALLNSAPDGRVEKSEIVGLALDLLAGMVAAADEAGIELTTLGAMRAHGEATIAERKYASTQVPTYAKGGRDASAAEWDSRPDPRRQNERPRGQRGRPSQ